MTKEKIFFSYSRADGSEFALRLATDLKEKGFNVWIDQQDIRAGLEWDKEIEKALISCDCVLFLETEKSVVSNNVLDEVYYALEQNKKVIPLIYVDSRTPFRLNRLQHIDFTRNYDKGLTQLVNELESNSTTSYQSESITTPTGQTKSFYKKNSTALLIFGLVFVLISSFVLFSINKNKTQPEIKGSISLTDTINNTVVETEPSNIPVNQIETSENSKSKEIITAKKTKEHNQEKSSASRSVNINYKPAEPKARKTETSVSNMLEMVTGDWRLVSTDTKAQSQRGYLKVESTGENKATIKSYMQFYYPESEASAYLTIFNAFAGCNSCIVNKEMKLIAEDIAVGSRTIKKLEEDQPDGRKAGETILDANSNKSIRGTVTLQFADYNNAIIKVRQPLNIELANGLMLEPFTYTFLFKKND